MLTSYVPYQTLSSNRTESTIFEKVYGGRRSRPTSISLNVQWVPVNNRSNTNRWTTCEIDNRIFKRETFFDTNAIREQKQPKAVTPPSSDYTDAYLNAFAPKPFPTRRIYRINTPAFANFAPIKTNLSMNNSIKTSETRFNTINNKQTSYPTSSSTYSSNVIPDIFPKYEPLSSTQSSSCRTQTHNSNDSTSFRNRQSYENTYQSIPVTSLQPHPSSPVTPSSSSSLLTRSAYKPSVSFQSAPSSLSNNSQQSSTNNQTVLLTSNTDKQINRPETLLFQPDEDIRRSSLEKPSPILTPLLESPIARLDSKNESEHTATEELSSFSSKPIEILEKTLNKYDTIIDQISEILASVSPLSSTMSSMSPGKSVLDYELTADGSPILQRKNIEAQQSITSSIKNTNSQRIKGKHLIREDSYDKIITAIADLDDELTPPPDTQKSTTTIIEEDDQVLTPSSDTLTSDLHLLGETKLDKDELVNVESITETYSDSTEFDQQGKDLLSNISRVETVQEEIDQSNDEMITNKNNEKRVTWGHSVAVNEDDESSLPESLIEEDNLPKIPTTITETEQLSSQISPTSIESSNLKIQQDISIESTEPSKNIIERQSKFASSSEPSSSFSDSVDRETSPSDLNESRSSHDEQVLSSRNSVDAQLVPIIDSSNKNTSTVDEQSPTNSDPQVDEIESNKIETPVQLIHSEEDEVKSLFIESPINALTDSISTRYISSDVYHSYLGGHRPFLENPSDIDTENNKISLIASLRQIITTPATPLIETIQSVVSSRRTLTATHLSKNDPEVIEHNPNDGRLVNAMSTDSNEESHEHESQIEENISMVAASVQPKITLESVHNTIMESIPTIESNLQTDEQEVLSTSIGDVKDVTSLESTSSSSLFNSVQEKASNAIMRLTDTIQNMIPTDMPLLQTPITEVESSINTLSPVENKSTVNKYESDATIEQKVDETNTSLEKTSHPSTTSTETLDTFISFSSTEDNPSLVEQYSVSTNDQTDVEQFQSTETISDQPSMHKQLSNAAIPNKPDTQLVSTESPTTAFTIDTDDETIVQKTIDELVNHIINIAISQLTYETNQNTLSSENSLSQPIISQNDNGLQRSTTKFHFDSISTKIENENIPSKSSVNYRESSPTNTELDSLELIHALQGHSIVLSNSSEQIYPPPEKSSSTTTSSQVTSSDRYVSYAIHQMGDSSQERLPSFPIAGDLPIYKTINEDIELKPVVHDHQLITREDDSTELDATENLTSYSDDILLHRVIPSSTNRQKYFDASSTDEDVDDEIEQHDLTDLERIIDKLTQTDSRTNINDEPYQRYDLATTPSSNDSSSSSRPHADDVYFIPGYSGLWRPSADNDSTNLPINYDADDERKAGTKTRTIVRTLNSTIRPVVFEPSHNPTHPEILTSGIPLRPNSIDLHHQSLNEYPYDISESDSYQTCPSSISKQDKPSKEKQQTSSEENIFLIHENERGVSLPITMKIDCDDMAFRLSTSSPINNQLYSRFELDSSPSTHSEPPLPIRTDPNSPVSSPLSNLPSWLNTINTVTTTMESTAGSPTSSIKLFKSAKGPISISECHPQGQYIIIENTSRSKTIDLKNWKIRQENDDGNHLIFIFPDHYLLKPNHSLKILANLYQSEQRNDDLIASSISSWHTGANILTILINPEEKDCATLTKKTIISLV